MRLDPHCPCGSQQIYAHCCEPYVTQKALAPTAEALMRSRYTAYCLGNVDYLIDTLHLSKRKPSDRLTLQRTCDTIHWVGLTILATQQGGIRDKRGIVEFIARYDRPELGQLHERSRFVKQGDRWFYRDGDILPSRVPQCSE